MWGQVYCSRKRAGQECRHGPGGGVGASHNNASLNKGSIQNGEVREDSLVIACGKPDAGDTAFRIHCLSRSAYAAVLRAFCAQLYFFPLAKQECLAELRNGLKLSDSEHRECIVKASTDNHIKSLRYGLYKGNIGNAEAMKGSLGLACVIPDAADAAFQIHCLERSAFASVLRAFCAQSDLLSWAKLINKLRNELSLSETEHREVIARVSSDDYIKSLRKYSLANYSGLMKKTLAFDVCVVDPDKIDKIGQSFTSLAQQVPMPVNTASLARNIGILGTSPTAKKGPCFDLHAMLPAKKLKSGNGSALAYFKCPPCAEQSPVAVSSMLAESSINDTLHHKTSLCDMKPGCVVSPTFEKKHGQSNAGQVPLCAHPDMQASRKRGAEVSPMSRSKSLSFIIHSAENANDGSDIVKIHLTSGVLKKVEKRLTRGKLNPAIFNTAKSILKNQERCLLDALVKLSEVSSAAAYPVQPDELEQHDEETPPPPKSVSGSSYEEAPTPTSTAITGPRRAEAAREEVETKGAQGRELEPAAKRAWRPTVKLLESELVKCLPRKRKKRMHASTPPSQGVALAGCV